jgi:tetratricopeptide (TPR) repeat protein
MWRHARCRATGENVTQSWWSIPPARWVALGCVLIVTAIALQPSLDNGFTNWDDPQYVTENERLQSIGLRGYWQAVHPVVAGNYHPLTMLTLAWDHQRVLARDASEDARLSARPYHVTNLVLHLGNTILVFVFAYLLGGRRLIVAVVSALFFGVHPLHVEAVAWISARKDVLYAFFYVAALILYLRYKQNGKIWAYALCLLAFALSLLSKPAAVVLPVTLLLLDDFLDSPVRYRLLVEKIPFLLGSIAMGIVTLSAQTASGAVSHASFSFLERCVLAGYGFTTYWIKLVAPVGLSALYPFPQRLSGAHLAMAAVAAAIGVVAVWSYRRCKSLFFAVAFFAVNVALVLQFLPVGSAIVADRYTYVAYIGIFFLAGVGLDRILQRSSTTLRYTALGLCAAAAIACAYASHERSRIWKDTPTLWSDVIERFPDTAFKAYTSRGAHLRQQGEAQSAVADFDRAIAIAPAYYKTYLSRANAYRDLGKQEGGEAFLKKSLEDLDTAVSLHEADPDIYNSRALTHFYLGHAEAALEDLGSALQHDPTHVDAYKNRARLWLALDRPDQAYRDYTSYLTYRPNDPVVLLLQADTALSMGRLAESEAGFTRCIDAAPNFGDCYLGRARVRQLLGQEAAARSDASRARQLAAESER